MSARAPSATSYARAVERALQAANARATLLSPKDWALIAGWSARGVPLAVVLEAVREASAPRRGRPARTRPLRLPYVAAAVEEAWGVILAGRSVDVRGSAERPRTLSRLRAAWLEAADRLDRGSELERRLRALVRSLDEGGDAGEIDAALDEILPIHAPADLRAAVESQTVADLASFRVRMDAPAFASTHRRAVLDRLRRALGLPRLAPAENPPRGSRR
jgi:hypothetical protein